MSLFDEGERNYTGYRSPRESIFAFLNRSGLPKFERTRTLLESWFRDCPAAHQDVLGTGFRSNEDPQHWGAFFELYCHTLLRHQGLTAGAQVIVDVAVNRPVDFLAQKDDTPLFYWESTVATGSKAVLANQRKIWELIDTLNVLEEPYFQVSIEVEQESSHNLPCSQIRSRVHRWLQTLDPEKVSEQRKTAVYDEHPHCSWERDEWNIVFFAVPRPLEDRGLPGETVRYHMWNAQWAEAQNSLRNALESKANRYGALQFPYVIAVDVLAIDSLGSGAGEVLFGKKIILINTQTGESTLTRSPLLRNRPYSEKGLWLAQGGPRNQQVSAVLLVDELMAWSVAHKTPILWHNPWAEKPLNPDLWQGPQMMLDKDALSPQMRYREGKEAFEILHLPLDWPDNDLENQSRVDK